MNSENLVPNTERSQEELREMGRKGGIKSGESRRRQRDMKKVMKLFAREILASELERYWQNK